MTDNDAKTITFYCGAPHGHTWRVDQIPRHESWDCRDCARLARKQALPRELRALVEAYADAFEAHEQSVFDYAQADLLHGGPRQQRSVEHRGPLEAASARYRETSGSVREARGAILAAIEAIHRELNWEDK